MSYASCPTCGYFLAQKTYFFEEQRKKICLNPNIKEEKREEEIQKLVKSLNLRYCCNMRMMTFKNLEEIILPVTE
tara:strand:+ start:385 stop:609 length:225 start_codon:yes stop_codon:yes gene_type:complete